MPLRTARPGNYFGSGTVLYLLLSLLSLISFAFISNSHVKKLVAAALLAGSACLLVSPTAQAQTAAPDFPAPGSPARPAPTPLGNADRARRQQQMSPEDAARDQQLQVLEARTGNTSLGAERGGPYRQLDKSGGSFTVRKFRALRGQEQERGVSRRVVMGARTTGKPLVHDHSRKKKFLLF